MFGKSAGQYLSFQKAFLAAIVVFFLVRLALSLAGTPSAWLHVFAHLVVGGVVLPLLSWGISSLVMLVTKISPRAS